MGVLLDGAALADEGALGAGARGWGAHKAALDGGPELRGKARGGAHNLALGEHRVSGVVCDIGSRRRGGWVEEEEGE